MSKLADKVAARYARGERGKTAASQLPPQFVENMGKGGGVEGGNQKRDIPKDHPFDPRALKPLSKALFATSVALGHSLTAHRHLSRIKSATISPDGMLGGRGYVMAVVDVRKKLWEASEALSAIADTLYDEIKAPHWQPKLAQLDENTMEDINRFVEESAGMMQQPEAEAEERIEQIEQENDGKGKKENVDAPPKEDVGSKQPTEGGPSQLADIGPAGPSAPTDKQASVVVQPTTLDDGVPRVDERGPATGEGPYGAFNEDLDPQLEVKQEYVEQDDLRKLTAKFARLPTTADLLALGRGEAIDALAASALPTDDTPTEGYDFGIGFGANGQGAENPQENLPKENQPTFVEDETDGIELGINRQAESVLPGEFDEPVARSDYYEGDRGNTVNTPMAASELPGEESAWQETNVTELPDTHAIGEDASTGYVRYDYSTPQHRRGPVHDPQKDIYQ